MRRIKPRIKYGDLQWGTWCEINGVEQDVLVHYYTSPAEPDVNHPGDCEVTGVYFEDEGCVMGQMTDDEIEAINQRVADYENERHDPDNYDYPED